jgi:hypothetical protein
MVTSKLEPTSSPSAGNAMSKEESLSIIENADLWVQFPLLPLVKRGEQGWPEAGFLVVDHGFTIYKKNMFELVGGPLNKQLEGVPTETFVSAKALLDAGWEVD